MRKRILTVVSLGILLMPGALWSQQTPVDEAEAPEQIIQILAVKHYPVGELSNILDMLSARDGTRIFADESGNRLIVRATPTRMQEIVELVKGLDVAGVSSPSSEPMLCRVYMIETKPKESGLKPFTVLLRTPSPVGSPDLLSAVEGDDLRIGRLTQDEEKRINSQQRILIRGVATSNEVVKRMIEAVPDSQVADLRWDDATFTANMSAAQPDQLPESLQKHIHKFLGADVQTVAYWFGSLSSPGEVEAPIGLWTLELSARPAQGTSISIDIKVAQKPQYMMDTSMTVLSNSIQGKVGKPIIIGYNRETYTTRTMGALVILLEADATP